MAGQSDDVRNALERIGAQTIEVTPADGGIHVAIRGEDSGYRASIDMLEMPDGNVLSYVDSNGNGLEILLRPDRAVVAFADSATGEAAEMRFDVSSWSWQSTPEAKRFVRKRQDIIAIMASQYFDHMQRPALIDRQEAVGMASKGERCNAPSTSFDTDTSETRAVSRKAIHCTGHICRGFGTLGGVASGCCADALNDANLCCWNSTCVGCCQTWSCDKACVIGDYICFCGVSGRACTSVY